VVDEALRGFGGQGRGDRLSTAVGLVRRRGGLLAGPSFSLDWQILSKLRSSN
jgi:hypothetical protein